MRRRLIASLTLIAASASAQPTFKSNEWTQATVDASRRAVVQILDRLRPTLRPDCQKYADPERVQVGAYGDHIANFNPSTGVIQIPFGLWHGFRLISWSYQDANDDPSLLPRVSAYLQFIALRMQNIQPNSSAVLQPDFRSWAGLPARAARSPAEEARRSSREVEFLVQAMAFVVAHELTHLCSRHKASIDISPAESRDQERLADARALKLFTEAGFDVLPAAMAMMVLGATKLTADGRLVQVPTHPHPFCRAYTTFTLPIHRRKDDADIVDGVRRAGMPSVDFFIGQLLSMKEACQ